MTSEDLVPGDKALEEAERGLEEERKPSVSLQDEKEAELCFRHSSSLPDVSASKVICF